MALHGIPQRNLHQFVLWKMASSSMLVLQVGEWMPIWWKVFWFAPQGWRTAKQEVQKEWWQKCSGYVEEAWAASWNGETRCFRLLIKYTTTALRIPGYGAAEVVIDLTEELRHPETHPMCKIHESRHADIRDQNPSNGMICPSDPHQRNPNAPKLWGSVAGRDKLKEKNKAAFFSQSENKCLPASNLKREGREFAVDSGASMHMISKKDLNSAEFETLTESCTPETVTTTNGEVQTHEEATVYVKEVDIFLTMKVLEDTPAILSFRKLHDEHGYSYEWINVKNHIS